MIVKVASYPSLERRRLLQITDGTGTVEELPLELRGKSIPAHKNGRAQALQNLVFFLNKGSTVVVILPCFGSVLLRSEHLTRPCLRQVGAQRVSTLPAPCVALIGRSSTHMRTIAPISEISSALNVSTSHCALHPRPHIIRHRQAAACPRAAQKTQTYRSLRFLQWQPWCRRQAQ
jgi:hypothetical protein